MTFDNKIPFLNGEHIVEYNKYKIPVESIIIIIICVGKKLIRHSVHIRY